MPETEYDDVRLRENLEDLSWVERTARRHEGVLEELLGQVTIVPLRLCTLYRDVDGVRRLLSQNAQELRDSLAKLDGCTEWGVKVFAGDVQVEMAVDGEAEPPAEGRGAAYLLERQREREHAGHAAELRAACAEAVHERISEHARASVSNPPQRPELHGRNMSMVLNGAYLVARELEAELRETVAGLQAEWASRGFVIELTGPWPGYNFASGVMP